MMVLDHAWGMLPENFPKCTTVKNKIDYDEMVKVKDIKIMSQCEHHWQTIDGYATIAYIPTGGVDVIGLSKLSRICDYFARRPQIQERLTCQIFEALRFILKTDNIAVHINAKHYCMVGRGIEDASAMTSTSKLGGAFKTQPATRSEFFSMLE
jgi:GTP cyclohydrolase I